MSVLFALEIIGTVAFAVSGAIVGMRKKMDLLGVAMLGMTTATGGGLLRDLMLSITPPAVFQKPILAVIAIGVSFVLFFRPKDATEPKGTGKDKLLLLMDSIGLGLFTVLGVRTALETVAGANAFLVSFIGVLTGVGGGLLRDLFAGNTPYIFVKHFYACASIIGAWFCILLWPLAGSFAAQLVGALLIVLLRLLAARFRWSLPKAG